MENRTFYFDPNHGGCLRIVTKLERDKYLIEGAYGSDEGAKFLMTTFLFYYLYYIYISFCNDWFISL